MTIGYVLDDTLDKPDGVQQAMVAIGEHMRSLGHRVHYIVAETERTDLKNVHSVGQFYSVKFNGNSVRTPRPASKSAIKQLFEDIAFDVIHVQMPYSPLLAGRVIDAAPSNVKVFTTFHILPYNWMSSAGTKLLGNAMSRQMKRIDHMFAVSEPARRFMEDSYGVKGSVLPNPIDYDFFAAKRRKAHKKKQIVFVGRFDERKGVKHLVKSYALIPEATRKDMKLTMCGKGPLLDAMQDLAAEENLDIEFPGFITEEQKVRYLTDADVAVFPSTSGESFGIVLTEAMAAGAKVTLGGDNPGYASVIGRWPEVIFNPKNHDEFADTLIAACNEEKYQTIGKEQHSYVKSFDIKLICKTLLDHYQ